jgi:hypothetical protein
MRKRTFGRWATRLAGVAVAAMAFAVAIGGYMAAASDFNWT